MAKTATKTTETASNVVKVDFRAGLNLQSPSKDFQSHFGGKGNATERLLTYLGHQFEIARKEKASIINMVALPDMRAAVGTWPSDRDDIAKDVLDVSAIGKAMLAEIESVPPKPRGNDAKRLARLRSRRNYVLGNMVKAKQLVGKLAEGEQAGWAFMIENDSPEILVAHTSRPLDIASTTAGVIINAKTFIGKSKWDDVTTRGADPAKPMEVKTTRDAIPIFKGLSSAFAKWSTGDIRPKLSASFKAELAQMIQFGTELLGVVLTSKQKEALEEIAETEDEAEDDVKAPDKDEDAAKQRVFADVDKRRAAERANNSVDK